MMSNFSRLMKERRKLKRMTLQELADNSGTCKSFIWEIENDRVKPGLLKAVAIADALGTDVYTLLTRRNPETERLRQENERLRGIVKAIAENDLNDMASDCHTVGMVIQQQAKEALNDTE